MKINSLITKIRIKLMTNDEYVDYLRSKGMKIGNGCNISKEANLGSEPWLIRIGNNVRITKGVDFITHDGGLWTLRKMNLIGKDEVVYGAIVIDDNCNISWNTIIMPGVHIGKNCVTAAGAVVTKDIPDGSIWGGIPARPIETIETYYEKIKDKTVPTFNMSSDEKQSYLKLHKPELFGGSS